MATVSLCLSDLKLEPVRYFARFQPVGQHRGKDVSFASTNGLLFHFFEAGAGNFGASTCILSACIRRAVLFCSDAKILPKEPTVLPACFTLSLPPVLPLRYSSRMRHDSRYAGRSSSEYSLVSAGSFGRLISFTSFMGKPP